MNRDLNLSGSNRRLTTQAKKSWRDAIVLTYVERPSWNGADALLSESPSRDRRFKLTDRCIREVEESCFSASYVVTDLFFSVVPPVRSPNKTPEPTLGLARFPQGSEVFNIVAGVAHL